jgi:fumarylacetoacetate (FAA) hydrolase family protein
VTDWTRGTAVMLPDDGDAGTLIGRVWDPAVAGPSVVSVRAGEIVDLSGSFATTRELTELADPSAAVASASGPVLGRLEELLANTPDATRDTSRPWLLSPIDLQVVKAAGVTFPVSMIERVIEEKARGDLDAAAGLRQSVLDQIGGELRSLKPGSADAERLKQHLVAQGMWSQYLEVGIGPDAEVFTKAPVLATVGTGVEVGIHSSSSWNNPEPEVVLVVASDGRTVGAMLGNDVNLRDIEGRSALLLPKAKDTNASAAVGPFIRLFDGTYGIDDVRREEVTLHVVGDDGYVLEASSPLTEISRDPLDIVTQVIGDHHQYPDGFVLYLGTLFAPIEDRAEPGRGFTHHVGDVVTISSPGLGGLVNRVQLSERVVPWTFGISELMTNLSRRGLLAR